MNMTLHMYANNVANRRGILNGGYFPPFAFQVIQPRTIAFLLKGPFEFDDMKDFARNLQTSLARSLPRHNVPGASVAVFQDGTWTAAAAGIANVTTGVEVTEETVMSIGSIAKVFTATLVMQLVDEGKVSLDEPIARYLPDLRLGEHTAPSRSR